MKFLFFFLLSNIFLFASIGKITAVNGKVIVDRDKQSLEANVGFNLEEKDFVSTSDNSKVQIIMADGTVLSLGKNSKLSINEYLYDQQNSKADFKFVEGTFKSITGAIGKIAPDKFKLETKSATIGIRGTIVVGNQEKVACTQGQIAVTSAGITQVLGAGMMTTTEIGKPPTPPTKIEGNLLKEIDSVGTKENKASTNDNSTAKSTEEKTDNKEKTSEKEQITSTPEQNTTQSSVQQSSISSSTIQNNLTSNVIDTTFSQLSNNINKIATDTTSSSLAATDAVAAAEAARLKAEADAAALAAEIAKKKADADALAAAEAARLKAEADAAAAALALAAEQAKITATSSLATEALAAAAQAVAIAQTEATKAADAAAIALANAQAASNEVQAEAQTAATLAQAAADLAAVKVLEAKNALNNATIAKTNISTATTSAMAQALLSDITTAKNTITAAGNTAAIAAINAQNQSKIITNIPFYSASLPINRDIGYGSIGFNVPTSNTNINFALYSIFADSDGSYYPEIQIFKEENGNYNYYSSTTIGLIGTSVLNLNLEAGNYKISTQGNFISNENFDLYVTSDKKLIFDDNNIKNYSYSNKKNNLAYLGTANNANIISEQNKAEFGALADSKVGTTILIKNADKNYSGEFVTISDSFLYLENRIMDVVNRNPIEVTDGSSWGYWTGNVDDFSDDLALNNIAGFNSTWISGNQVTPPNNYKATFQGQVIGKVNIGDPMFESRIELNEDNFFRATIDIGSGTITNSMIKFTSYDSNANYWLGTFNTSDVNKVNTSGFSSSIVGTTTDYNYENIKDLTGSLSGNYFGITNADGSQNVKSIGGQFTMTSGTEVATGVFKASNEIKYLNNITYLTNYFYQYSNTNNADYKSLVDSKVNTSKYIQNYHFNNEGYLLFQPVPFVTMPDSFLVDYGNSSYYDYYNPDSVDLNNEIVDGSSWGYLINDGIYRLNVWLSGNKVVPNADYKATFNGQVIGTVSNSGNYGSILLNKANSFGATIDIGSSTITNSHINFMDNVGGSWSGTFNGENVNQQGFSSNIVGTKLYYYNNKIYYYDTRGDILGNYFGTNNPDGSQNVKSIGGQFSMSNDNYSLAKGVFKANTINTINIINNETYFINAFYNTLVSSKNNISFKSLADSQIGAGNVLLNTNFVTMPDSFLVDYINSSYDYYPDTANLNNEIADGSSWGYLPNNGMYQLNTWLSGNTVIPNTNYKATFNGQVIGNISGNNGYILIDKSNSFGAKIDIGSSTITNSHISFRDSAEGTWSGRFDTTGTANVNILGFSSNINGTVIRGEDTYSTNVNGYLSGNYFGTTNPDGSQNVKSIGGQFTMSDYNNSNVATGVFKANNINTINNVAYIHTYINTISEVNNNSSSESLVDSQLNTYKNIQITNNYYMPNFNDNFRTMSDSFLVNYSDLTYPTYINDDNVVPNQNIEIPDSSSWGYWAEDPNQNSMSTNNQLHVWLSGNKVIPNQDYKATFNGQVIGNVAYTNDSGHILLNNDNSFKATIDINNSSITDSSINFKDSKGGNWSGTFDTAGTNVNILGFSAAITKTNTTNTIGALSGNYFGTKNADGSPNVKSIGGSFNMYDNSGYANGVFKARPQ